MSGLLQICDLFIASLFPWLSLLILIFALDDFFVDLWRWRVPKRSRREPVPEPEQQCWIAIFVPCWQEHAVIERMIRHNTSTIRYDRYRWFLGVYPNDHATRAAAERLAAQLPRVSVAVCAHAGPTSKADCLNWIYQRMLLYEQEHGIRFDLVTTHDAEDVIHADEMIVLNHQPDHVGMVQIPVLPLPTPWYHLTHGVYMDDFSEWQSRDMEVRAAMRAFIPSAGVGTAYSREALAALARDRNNCIFEPGALTEDYENGLRLHELGFRQVFVALTPDQKGQWLATREYFPQTRSTAIRQRSRWTTGIMLQAWQKHGWRGSLATKYWFWRDRKGILGHPASALANLILFYALLRWLTGAMSGTPWQIATITNSPPVVLWVNLLALLYRSASRIWTTGIYFGPAVASLVPIRMLWGNYINLVAMGKALHRYARARMLGVPLIWVKTAHQYPRREALFEQRLPMAEILMQLQAISREEAAALPAMDGDVLAERLRNEGRITEDAYLQALALHHGLATASSPLPPRRVARALPLHLVKRWEVIPVQLRDGAIEVATPRPPSTEMLAELQQHLRVDLQVSLISRQDYEQRLREMERS